MQKLKQNLKKKNENKKETEIDSWAGKKWLFDMHSAHRYKILLCIHIYVCAKYRTAFEINRDTTMYTDINY